MQDVDIKIEASRLATLIMTQSATAARKEQIPSPDEVLAEAKKFYKWFKD